MAAQPSYTYRAAVESVYDGDTFRVTADLGFSIFVRLQVRLTGINAAELSAPGGREARDHLAGLLPTGSQVVLHSVKADKYGGRSDAVVFLPDGRSVADVMVADGFAARWDGAGQRPVPVWPR